jgi:hypothetical protein
MTEPRTEHDCWNSEERYQEDSDALQTELRVYNELGCVNRDFQWTKERAEVESKILNRFDLKREIVQAKLQVREVSDLVYRKTISASDGTILEGEELKVEITRRKAIAVEEAQAELMRLEGELAEAIASDPAYEPPEFTPEGESASASVSAIPEPVIPVTPSNDNRVASRAGQSCPTEGVDLNLATSPQPDVPLIVPTPAPFVLKQEYDGMPIAASTAPPTSTLAPSQPTSLPRVYPPYYGEICRLLLHIRSAQRKLSRLRVDDDGPCPSRDDIQREMTDLQQQLDEVKTRQLNELDNTGPSGSRDSGLGEVGEGGRRGGETPLTATIITPTTAEDVKPIITSTIDIKPIVRGGNRWAYLAPKPIINGVDPRRPAKDDQKPRVENIQDEIRRLKVCRAF